MEEALGARGHGFLEEHDALIGLAADELQVGEAARRPHVEMLPAARGHDKAFRCIHASILPGVISTAPRATTGGSASGGPRDRAPRRRDSPASDRATGSRSLHPRRTRA